jgi:DNA-entry nuclease
MNTIRRMSPRLLALLLALVVLLPGCEMLENIQSSVTLDDIPEFTSEAYVVLQDNQPSFTQEEMTTTGFESYSPLDALGRCGVAYACVGLETMPTEERGAIGQVKPSGWHLAKYDCVDGKYLYNRCHLIGYQLTGENANEQNLITGTRYLNVTGMLPFENQVADYVKETGNHVLYRVTPIFQGSELVARGLQMEAWSVEDEGAGICFNVYVYNVQPGVTIDYATGESWLAQEQPPQANQSEEDGKDAQFGDQSSGSAGPTGDGEEDLSEETDQTDVSDQTGEQIEGTYVLNTKSKRFHLPECSGVSGMSEGNKQTFTGLRQELIDQGYAACGICKP